MAPLTPKERLAKALDALVYLPHLRDADASGSPAATAPGGGAAATGRPWDRGDLFRRLQTFKAATWFAKPPALAPAECARRGWRNVGPDALACESCAAVVACPLAPGLAPDEAAAAAAAHAARLAAAHAAGCPWRAAECPPALLRFPPLPAAAAAAGFARRAAALEGLACLPPADAGALAAMGRAAGAARLRRLLLRGALAEREGEAPGGAQPGGGGDDDDAAAAALLLEGPAVCGDGAAHAARARLLALCGWDVHLLSAGGAAPPGPQPRAGPESAALACALCGARAGLWAFFEGVTPRALASPLAAAAHAALPPPPAAGTPAAAAAPASAGGGNRRLSDPGLVEELAETTIAGGAVAGVAPAEGAAPAAPFGAAGGARDAAPAFGFQALEAAHAERQQAGGGGAGGARSAAAAGAKRKRQEAAAAAATAAAAAAAAAALVAANAAADAAAAAAAAPAEFAPLGAADAARCRALAARPLDPLALHRGFCPWAAAGGGDAEGRCGWLYVLGQLAPAGGGAAGAGAPGGDALGDGRGERGAGWDPASVLRAAISKVASP